MTELSWPIEKIERHPRNPDWWVKFKGMPDQMWFTADELAAAGIPAAPHPTPPVTITVTVGDRSEVVELTELNIETALASHEAGTNSPFIPGINSKVGAALQRLGVQP